MSFHVARKNDHSAAKLLQLFAFLNPDGILIEFLQAGINAFDDSLRTVLSNQIEMAKALIELENLSLIKWDRRNQSISIHRLVQAFIADGLSTQERMSTVNTIVSLVETFPKEITSEIYPVCRLYESQVLEPLLRLKPMPSQKLADIMVRVGVFLCEDGKYYDSEKLLVEALQISTDILGSEAPETLVVMLFLAWTYGEQRRGDDSIKLYETALKTRKKITGEEHEKTLIAMHSLAWAYQKQGRNGDAIPVK
jgi:tetratricopeptide (TPR) repeat protein